MLRGIGQVAQHLALAHVVELDVALGCATATSARRETAGHASPALKASSLRTIRFLGCGCGCLRLAVSRPLPVPRTPCTSPFTPAPPARSAAPSPPARTARRTPPRAPAVRRSD